MDRRRATRPEVLGLLCEVAGALRVTIRALAGEHDRDIVAAAEREYARMLAIAASDSRAGRAAERSYTLARGHVARLEDLLMTAALDAADRCRRIADELARREEWTLLDVADEPQQRSAAAAVLACRLQRWAAEDGSRG
jgi:hypothetical protein